MRSRNTECSDEGWAPRRLKRLLSTSSLVTVSPLRAHRSSWDENCWLQWSASPPGIDMAGSGEVVLFAVVGGFASVSVSAGFGRGEARENNAGPMAISSCLGPPTRSVGLFERYTSVTRALHERYTNERYMRNTSVYERYASFRGCGFQRTSRARRLVTVASHFSRIIGITGHETA